MSGFIDDVGLSSRLPSQESLAYHNFLFFVLREKILEKILCDQVPAKATHFTEHVELGEVAAGEVDHNPALVLLPFPPLGNSPGFSLRTGFKFQGVLPLWPSVDDTSFDCGADGAPPFLLR